MPEWLTDLLIDLIAVTPVVGVYIAPIVQVSITLFNLIWPVIENTGWISDTMGAVGLDSTINMTSGLGWLNPANITSGITNLPQSLQSDALGATSSATGFVRRGMGDVNRIFRDLQLSWQWFMNPENPNGYRQIMRMFSFLSAQTQPHLRVNQPPRVGFIYNFPDPYLLSYNLTPSYYVAGGRI